ncbi:MAG: hypothetical protein B6I26_05855 [Desulfobacteraceae bacterium 4572_130]|nr:MAG: hypothetical protein B6I26_05855 [Desulfobacteraceae bacterium 4572_130]
MSTEILGLEIKKHVLVGLIIQKTLKSFSVKEAGYVKYNELPESSNNEESDSFFINALELLLKKIDIKNCTSTALCVPASFVSFKNIDIPFQSKKKIKQILPFELISYLPFSDQNFLSDFIVLNSSLQTTNILTASIPESIIKKYFDSLKKFGIKSGFITPSGYASANYFLKKKDEKFTNTVFLDIRDNNIVLIIAQKNVIIYIRCISIYHEDFMIQSIEQTIMGIRQKFGSNLIFEQCLITSYSKKNDAFCEKIEKTLRCPVKYADFKDMFMEFVNSEFSMFSNALSAAVISTETKSSLNFCQGQYALDSFFKKNIKKLSIMLLFIIIFSTSGFLNIYTDVSVMNKKNKGLDNAILSVFKKNFPDVKKIVDPIVQMETYIKDIKKKSLKPLGDNEKSNINNYKAIDILVELSNLIPDSIDIEISRFVLNNHGRLSFSGTMDNFNNVDKIKGLIKESNMFKDVKISDASADKAGKKVRFKFLIEI